MEAFIQSYLEENRIKQLEYIILKNAFIKIQKIVDNGNINIINTPMPTIQKFVKDNTHFLNDKEINHIIEMLFLYNIKHKNRKKKR